MSSDWTRREATVRPEVKVVLEEGANNWSAYVPSVPVVIATGGSREEVEGNIERALTAHLAYLHEQDLQDESEEAAKAESKVSSG